jgi:hypothetical protein
MFFFDYFYLYDWFACFMPIAGIFWLWMLYDCIRYEPERSWIWILILLNFPGAVIYFIFRKFPTIRQQPPRFLGRWFRGKEIRQAEIDARNIGNTYHFVKLGDILRETGQYEKAGEAYRKALETEDSNVEALWGAAVVDMKAGRFKQAHEKLTRLMEIDYGFKFGEAAKAYAATLLELGELETARKQAEKCAKRWDDPESAVLLAQVLIREGRHDEAKKCLENLIDELKGNPHLGTHGYRKWMWRGRLMLRNCKAASD